MKGIKFWIVLLFSSVLLYQNNKAQSFYAQVSAKKVQVGVPFDFQIVIMVNASNYVPPAFKDFDIVSGPYQSNSSQNVNGVVSQQILLSYGLVAKKEGKLTIGAASIVSNGQKLESAPIAIEAVKGAAGTNADPNSGKVGSGDVFIRTGVSKSKCYIGEQVTVIQKVYSRIQMVNFIKFEQPAYDGFYSQAQESTSKGMLGQENVDGVMYYTFELFRTLATANQVGKISLTPIEGDVVVRKQTNSRGRTVIEQFFGGGGYEDIPVTTKSKSLVVDVLPLPEEGKPDSFNGAVGSFQYKVQATRNELKANDAFNLKMTITGKGNLKLISAPKLNLPESFEIYDPKVSDNGTSKTFDYLVIPREEGEFHLNGLDFSYFNLDTKKYITIPAGDVKVKVLAPDPNASGAKVYTSQSQVKETENDIRYIKKGDFVLMKADTEFFNSFSHIALIFMPLFALIGVLFFRRNHIKNNSNQVLVKERKAASLAKKQLMLVEKLVAENKKDEFYTEILNALNNYLSHKLNIPASDLSREKINLILVHKQINQATLGKLMSTLDTSEYAKYAPGAVSGDLRSVYTDTANLITDLEQQLNKKFA